MVSFGCTKKTTINEGEEGGRRQILIDLWYMCAQVYVAPILMYLFLGRTASRAVLAPVGKQGCCHPAPLTQPLATVSADGLL